jgi:hypothetical protein
MKPVRLLATVAAMAMGGSAFATIPMVNDEVVQSVVVEGNKDVSTASIMNALQLKNGGALSRAAVLADNARIEALYKKSGRQVQVWPNLTHPGEGARQAVTTLTFNLIEGAAPRHYDELADPLENYYGNTLVCAAAQTLNDLCHLWLNRDGSFINFDSGEAKTGHYVTGPRRADGKVAVCQYWDTPTMVTPEEISPRRGGPPPAPAPAAGGSAPPTAGGPPGGGAANGGAPGGGVMICATQNYRSTCLRGVDEATLTADDRKLIPTGMGDRFYKGLCYPIGPHDVGDIWFEKDDPLPGQLGTDRVLLIRGRQ